MRVVVFIYAAVLLTGCSVEEVSAPLPATKQSAASAPELRSSADVAAVLEMEQAGTMLGGKLRRLPHVQPEPQTQTPLHDTVQLAVEADPKTRPLPTH